MLAASSVTRTSPRRPRGSVTARSSRVARSSSLIAVSRTTMDRESSGCDDGERGILGGCCHQGHDAVLHRGQQRILLGLENRCTSSTKSTVSCPIASASRADVSTSRTSLTPAVTAESSTNRRLAALGDETLRGWSCPILEVPRGSPTAPPRCRPRQPRVDVEVNLLRAPRADRALRPGSAVAAWPPTGPRVGADRRGRRTASRAWPHASRRRSPGGHGLGRGCRTLRGPCAAPGHPLGDHPLGDEVRRTHDPQDRHDRGGRRRQPHDDQHHQSADEGDVATGTEAVLHPRTRMGPRWRQPWRPR